MKQNRPSKYEWLKGWVGELQPGEAYLAVKDQQFTCEPESFTSAIYRFAKEAGWKATVVCFSDRVCFSFYRADDYLRPNMAAYPIVRKLRGER